MPKSMPRRGRPPMKASERRRHILSVRVRDETRSRLEAAAAAKDRSVSEEAENRIERSFEQLDLLPRVLETAYGRELGGLLMVAGRVMMNAGSHAGFMSTPSRPRREDWPEDAFAYDIACKALSHVIEAFRPSGPIEQSEMAKGFASVTGFHLDTLSQGWAAGAINAIAGRPATEDERKFAETVRPLLGRLAEIDGGESK